MEVAIGQDVEAILESYRRHWQSQWHKRSPPSGVWFIFATVFQKTVKTVKNREKRSINGWKTVNKRMKNGAKTVCLSEPGCPHTGVQGAAQSRRDTSALRPHWGGHFSGPAFLPAHAVPPGFSPLVQHYATDSRRVVGVLAIVLRFGSRGQSPADPEGIEAISRWSRSQRRRYHRTATGDRIHRPWKGSKPGTLRTLRVRLPGKRHHEPGVSLRSTPG